MPVPEVKVIIWPWSKVTQDSLLSTFLLIFFSETNWPIKVKFHVGPPWDGETKDCLNDPGHMTKMTTMPMYGKNI